jgi:hypothetical protein
MTVHLIVGEKYRVTRPDCFMFKECQVQNEIGTGCDGLEATVKLTAITAQVWFSVKNCKDGRALWCPIIHANHLQPLKIKELI